MKKSIYALLIAGALISSCDQDSTYPSSNNAPISKDMPGWMPLKITFIRNGKTEIDYVDNAEFIPDWMITYKNGIATSYCTTCPENDTIYVKPTY